jgi:hypothetical protein
MSLDASELLDYEDFIKNCTEGTFCKLIREFFLITIRSFSDVAHGLSNQILQAAGDIVLTSFARVLSPTSKQPLKPDRVVVPAAGLCCCESGTLFQCSRYGVDVGEGKSKLCPAISMQIRDEVRIDLQIV